MAAAFGDGHAERTIFREEVIYYRPLKANPAGRPVLNRHRANID
jgi:hypothetical protein